MKAGYVRYTISASALVAVLGLTREAIASFQCCVTSVCPPPSNTTVSCVTCSDIEVCLKKSACPPDSPLVGCWNTNDPCPFPELCGGGMGGDPYAFSWDGLQYSFQAAGEYVLVTEAVRNLIMQVRLQPWHKSRVASVITAFALKMGDQRLVFYAGKEDAVLVDGQPISLECQSAGPKTLSFDPSLSGCSAQSTLSSGATLHAQPTAGNAVLYAIVHPLGPTIELALYRDHIDVDILRPAGPYSLGGLLGNADGTPENDIFTRDGRMLSALTLTCNQLHREFGDSWRIRQEESLFDYAADESTATFTDFTFPDRCIDPSNGAFQPKYNDAVETCRAAGVSDESLIAACATDVSVTGDPTWAEPYVGKAPPRMRLVLSDEPDNSQPTCGVGRTHSATLSEQTRDRSFLLITGVLGCIILRRSRGGRRSGQDNRLRRVPRSTW